MKNNAILKKIIAVASKREKADLVIKNINIVDVFTQSIYRGDIAISGGYIAGIGEYNSANEIDGEGKYISPSFIDAHMHLESSLVTPDVYEQCAIPHGVTAVIADPHEIANVGGKAGIEYFIEASSKCTLDFYTMLPSCVPATSIDQGGSILKAEDIREYYNNEKVLGLAEVMDSKSVLEGETDMITKLFDALKINSVIDGHCAGMEVDLINAYTAANISTDHECQSTDEVLDRLRRGMYVLMREGTAAKNLRDLSKIVTPANSRRICLCTDDKHIDELISIGSIDEAVRIAIEEGIPAPTAYQMATINTAECYRLKDLGAIAPGYKADFLILSDLDKVKIDEVYKNGVLVAKNGESLFESSSLDTVYNELLNSVKLPNIKKEDLNITIKSSEINVIEFIPNKLETIHVKEKMSLETEFFVPDTNRDLLTLLVINRYSGELEIGKGIIKGFSLKEGAIGTTIAHDSHNIILVGTNSEDIYSALKELENIQGGIVYSRNQKIEAKVQLEIGGLITQKDSSLLLKELDELHHSVKINNHDFNPFLALSFLALSVIPEIKLTAKGLYSSKSGSIIPLEV